MYHMDRNAYRSLLTLCLVASIVLNLDVKVQAALAAVKLAAFRVGALQSC